MLRIGLFASAALFLAACASTEDAAAQSGERDCFRSGNVTGFNVIDRNTIQVRVGVSRRYIFTTNWPTTNLDFSQRIGLRSSTGFICTGNGLGVEIIGGQPSASYPVASITRAPEPAPQQD
jgi:hypothetical protein